VNPVTGKDRQIMKKKALQTAAKSIKTEEDLNEFR
jgi:hypothetical protein